MPVLKLSRRTVYIKHLISSLSVIGRGDRAVHSFREDSLNLCTARPPWNITWAS